jgi:ribosomal protein S27E
MITVHCPCGAKLGCDDSKAGKRGKCPKCGRMHAIVSTFAPIAPEEIKHLQMLRFPCPFCNAEVVFDRQKQKSIGSCKSCQETLVTPTGSFLPGMVLGRDSGFMTHDELIKLKKSQPKQVHESFLTEAPETLEIEPFAARSSVDYWPP